MDLRILVVIKFNLTRPTPAFLVHWGALDVQGMQDQTHTVVLFYPPPWDKEIRSLYFLAHCRLPAAIFPSLSTLVLSAKEICLAFTFSHMFQMCRGVIVNNVIICARTVYSYRVLFPSP